MSSESNFCFETNKSTSNKIKIYCKKNGKVNQINKETEKKTKKKNNTHAEKSPNL